MGVSQKASDGCVRVIFVSPCKLTIIPIFLTEVCHFYPDNLKMKNRNYPIFFKLWAYLHVSSKITHRIIRKVPTEIPNTIYDIGLPRLELSILSFHSQSHLN